MRLLSQVQSLLKYNEIQISHLLLYSKHLDYDLPLGAAYYDLKLKKNKWNIHKRIIKVQLWLFVDDIWKHEHNTTYNILILYFYGGLIYINLSKQVPQCYFSWLSLSRSASSIYTFKSRELELKWQCTKQKFSNAHKYQSKILKYNKYEHILVFLSCLSFVIVCLHVYICGNVSFCYVFYMPRNCTRKLPGS